MKTQENIINNDINQISAESLALLNSIDYEKPLRADDFKNIANNYEYWLANTSAEKRAKVREQMTETQKGKKSNVLGILEKLLENPNYVFTEDEKAILDEYPEVLEELNIDKDIYISTDDGKKLKETQKARIELQAVIERLAENGQLTEENLKKSIEANDKRAEIAALQGIDIAETVKSFHEKSIGADEPSETKFNEDIEEIGPSTGLVEISPVQLENYFNLEFESMDDPALANMEQRIDGIELEELTFEQSESNKPVEERNIPELTEKETYVTPTIQVEKKGLAKWFDGLKKSKNPFAKLITGSMWRKQDNLLNAPEPQKYEDKPSTGRFDSTDTHLMPVGKGTRNSIIQAMETISRLFKKSKQEKQPAKVMEPVTPKKAIDRYVLDTDSLGSNNVIVPTAVNQKVNAVDSKEGTPVIEEDDGWSK